MAASMQTSRQDFTKTQLSKLLPGHQRYHVEVPGTASAVLLDVVAVDATETLGEPYRIQINLAHPQELERSDYLGKLASFHITPPPPDWLAFASTATAARKFSGCITGFNKTGHSADLHHYTFVIEPVVARLRLVRNNRIYQRQTAPQIIEASQFQFKLRRVYPVHAFRMQSGLSGQAYQHHLQAKHQEQEQPS